MVAMSKASGNPAGMKCRTTFDEYLEDPIRGYTVGPLHLLWCHDRWLSGIVFWGRLKHDHIKWLDQAQSVHVEPWQRLRVIDLRRAVSIDAPVFDSLTEYLRARAAILTGSTPAVAVLRPEGLVGAMIAGLCKIYNLACRVEVFTDPYQALTWLGAADASPVVPELDELLCRVTVSDPLVSALRSYLGQNPGKADLTTVSAALGMSGRALQRRLKGAHTSLQAEKNAAQIQFAKALLRDTDYEVKRIAFEVGCSSPAAFSALFRRIEGEAPSVWRSQTEPANRPPCHRLLVSATSWQ